MTSQERLWSMVLAAVWLPSLAAQAQPLTPGTWSGHLALEGGPSVSVQYLVIRADAGITVTMNVIDGPPSSVTDIALGNDELAFRWGHLLCRLKGTQDSTYEGKCVGPDGAKADLTLVPPADEASADEDAKTDSTSDVLTTDDLVGTRASNVYDALQRLRPQWLRPRGPARILYTASVHVYFNNQPVGGVDFLKTLEPDAVVEMRFYTASEANMRFGGNNEGGVIAITQRR